MATIIVRNLHFAYPGTDVFRGLELTLDCGWRTALIGRNGRGKTTLLRLIEGTLEPEQGHIERPMLPFRCPTAAEPARTTLNAVIQAVAPFERWQRELDAFAGDGGEAAMARYGEQLTAFEAAGGYDIEPRAERELDALGIDTRLKRRPFGTLSGGEQTRALTACLFLRRDAYPLVDEPTNHLDLDGRRLLAGYLATKPGFLLVSHDRAFLDEAVDHAVFLGREDVQVVAGNYSVWRRELDARLAAEHARNAHLKREIRQLSVAAGQRRAGALARERDKAAHVDKGYVGHRAARQMKRAIGIERRIERNIEERRQLLGEHEKARALALGSRPGRAGERVLLLSDATVARGGRTLVERFSLEVRRGERIALKGPNGAGKTTLLDVLAGEGDSAVRHAPGIEIARARQTPEWQHGALDDALAAAKLDAVRFRQILAVMGFAGDAPERPLETMSQGQLKKIELARSFARPADLYLWDEPLNYLDVETRERLEAAVLASAATLVFVEHDRQFIERVATRVTSLWSRTP